MGSSVLKFEFCIKLCADHAEPAWDFLSLSLSLKINFKKIVLRSEKNLADVEWLGSPSGPEETAYVKDLR